MYIHLYRSPINMYFLFKGINSQLKKCFIVNQGAIEFWILFIYQ